MRNLLFSLLMLGVLGGCGEAEPMSKVTQNLCCEQEMLITYGWYDMEIIYSEYDLVDSLNIDSLSTLRKIQARKAIETQAKYTTK